MKDITRKIQEALDKTHVVSMGMTEAQAEADIASRLDALAVELMSTRPDLEQMSLGEWLAEHDAALSPEEVKAASAIIGAYYA